MSFVPYQSKLLVAKMVYARAEMTLCFPKLAYVGQTVKIIGFVQRFNRLV